MNTWQIFSNGMTCLVCKEDGPNIKISGDDIPFGMSIISDFCCGECGRRWRWQVFGPDMYGLIGEMEKEEVEEVEEI